MHSCESITSVRNVCKAFAKIIIINHSKNASSIYYGLLKINANSVYTKTIKSNQGHTILENISFFIFGISTERYGLNSVYLLVTTKICMARGKEIEHCIVAMQFLINIAMRSS